MVKTRKLVLIGSIAAVAVAALAIGITFSLPAPAFANTMFHPMGGFGPWHSGGGAAMWQAWHSGNGFMGAGNESKANWTGSVSVQSLSSGMIDSVKGKVKVDIVDAASTAEKALGNGSKIGAITLAPVNGYLVYQAYGVDGSNNVHRLIIDVGNGNVLENSKMDMASGVGPWSSHGPGGMWQ